MRQGQQEWDGFFLDHLEKVYITTHKDNVSVEVGERFTAKNQMQGLELRCGVCLTLGTQGRRYHRDNPTQGMWR